MADYGEPTDVSQVVGPQFRVVPGSVIRCRPVGVLHMTWDDGGGGCQADRSAA